MTTVLRRTRSRRHRRHRVSGWLSFFPNFTSHCSLPPSRKQSAVSVTRRDYILGNCTMVSVVFVFLLLWTVFFIVVKFFEALSSGRLSLALESRNVTFKFGYISFYTTHFNSAIHKLAISRRPLLVLWFGWGVITGFFLFLLSAYLLVSNLLHVFPVSSSTPAFKGTPPTLPPGDHHAPPYPVGVPLSHGSSGGDGSYNDDAVLLASRRPRIPFWRSKPWFVPPIWYKLFIPSDHIPSTVVLDPRQPNLFDAVARWGIRTWSHGLTDDQLDDDDSRLQYARSGSRRRRGPDRQPCDKSRLAGRKFRRATGRIFGSHSRNASFIFAPWLRRRRGRGRRRFYLRGGRRLPPHLRHRPPPPPHPHPHPPFHHHHHSRHHYNHFDHPPPPPPPHQPQPPPADAAPLRRRRLLAIAPEHRPSFEDDNEDTFNNNNGDEGENNNDGGKGEDTVEGDDNDDHQRRRQSAMNDQGAQAQIEPLYSSSSSGFLTPLVPGVTVPAGDIWYMLAAVLIAGVVHEFGHALAAGAEYGEVSGMGAFIALVLPGAYVRLGGIDDMPPKSQLRVYCAGAWHNVVTGLLALLLLLVLPLLATPFYATGALVVDVPAVSPLHGFIAPGDRIIRLGRFNVHNGGESFRNAVTQLHATKDSVGFCVPTRKLAKASVDHTECCTIIASNSNQSTLTSHSTTTTSNSYDNNTYYDETDDTPIHKDGSMCYQVVSLTSRKVCAMPNEIEPFDTTCRSASECPTIMPPSSSSSSSTTTAFSASSSDTNLFPLRQTCVKPIPLDNKQLIDVLVHTAANRTHVHYFYEGYPTILGQGVTVSSYVPRFWHVLPWRLLHMLAVSDVPNSIERLLQYLSSISFGLAIMNMAPVLYLDGQATVALFVRVLFKKYPLKKINRISSTTLTIGSTLLVLNLILSIANLDKG